MIVRYEVSALLVAALCALGARTAHPCAAAPPEGFQVSIDAEEAIVVWDAETQTETFIRRASFSTDAPDFGFLVPTPSQPELAELPTPVFDTFRNALVAPVEYVSRTKYDIVLCTPLWMMRGGAMDGATAGAPSVEVLEQRQVAGYEVSVLHASDAGALLEWLQSHGYAVDGSLRSWLAVYIDQGWVISAFRVAKEQGDDVGVETGTVAMTFTTDSPFFPYREPQRPAPEGGHPHRMLRVFVLSDGPVDGAIGDDSVPWPGRVRFSDRAESRANALADHLPHDTLARATHLTIFEDESSPRPGHDELFFTASERAQPIRPEPYVMHTTERREIPLDIVVVVVGIGLWLMRRRRRAASAPA